MLFNNDWQNLKNVEDINGVIAQVTNNVNVQVVTAKNPVNDTQNLDPYEGKIHWKYQTMASNIFCKGMLPQKNIIPVDESTHTMNS